jgi:trigger factor
MARTVSWRCAGRREPSAVNSTVTKLEDSRVRVQVEVPVAELEGVLERKAKQLGRELKLPGFRRGKVPAPLVIQRLGREAVLEQAVRDRISKWYADAIDGAGIVPVGDPEVDLGELPRAGEALRFSIEIGVVPRAQLDSYEDLEVPRREPSVDEAQIDQEIEGLRDRLARLDTAERPAAQGDYLVIEYRGELPADGGGASRGRALPGAEGRDQLIELGGGNLIDGFEQGLLGVSAGETRAIEVTFPADHPNPELAGREATLEVTVKEVKQKQLPEADDDLAIDAGFDDLKELRDDIGARLLEVDEARAEGEFRRAALDAVVARASVPVTPELIKARAREMWERMLHALSHRGISREAYLQVSGRSEEESLAEIESDAEQALRREAVLTAIVAEQGIEVSDEELLATLTAAVETEGEDPQALLERLRSSGRLEDLREEEAAKRAVERIAERAKPISPAAAQAREQLWTPDRSKIGQQRETEGAGAEPAAAVPGRLWTPGDR